MTTLEKSNGSFILMQGLLLLQNLRSDLEKSKNIKAQKLAELEATLAADPEYTSAVESIKTASDEILNVEKAIKDQAVELYNANPDAGKKLAGGNVSIIEKVSAEIIDRNLAYEWAVKEAPSMIILDEPAIIKHAKAVKDTLPLAFVEIKTEPKAQIASEIKLELIQPQEQEA